VLLLLEGAVLAVCVQWGGPGRSGGRGLDHRLQLLQELRAATLVLRQPVLRLGVAATSIAVVRLLLQHLLLPTELLLRFLQAAWVVRRLGEVRVVVGVRGVLLVNGVVARRCPWETHA
jgi:hypothetical protein